MKPRPICVAILGMNSWVYDTSRHSGYGDSLGLALLASGRSILPGVLVVLAALRLQTEKGIRADRNTCFTTSKRSFVRGWKSGNSIAREQAVCEAFAGRRRRRCHMYELTLRDMTLRCHRNCLLQSPTSYIDIYHGLSEFMLLHSPRLCRPSLHVIARQAHYVIP